MQDRVEQQFGNYRLIRLIGKGGYADVYLAEHVYLKEFQYAIKVLTGTNLEDYKQDKFLLEARAIASLQRLNLHIVQIRDFGVQPGQVEGVDCNIPYIVMEYASAGTLRRLYPEGVKVPLERIMFYTNQIASALQCAHEHKPPIVHSDVKPENMLLRSIDHVLLSDFGIAVTGLTGPIMAPTKEDIVGTVVYMAPERFSRHMHRASDQYSLGVVVYEWLCGALPFKDTEAIIGHLKGQLPALYGVYSHITKEIENVVMRALAKKPEDRYPTIQAFAHALETAILAALPAKQSVQSSTGATASLQGQQNNTLVEPTVRIVPPKNQAQQGIPTLPGGYPGQHFTGPTEPFGQKQTPSTSPPFTRPSRPPTRRVRDFFELSPQFARDRRYSFFRTGGYVLNILADLLCALLLQNIYVLVGIVVSLLLWTLCIRAVEAKLTLFFSILLALYWGWIGWMIGAFIAPLLQSNAFFTKCCLSFVLFTISMYLHAWYVARKNL